MKKVNLLSARHFERYINDAHYMNSTEFSKCTSWYCPDMFRTFFLILFMHKNAINIIYWLNGGHIGSGGHLEFLKWARCIKASQLCHAQVESNTFSTSSCQISVENADLP